jgi:hypothetical protein
MTDGCIFFSVIGFPNPIIADLEMYPWQTGKMKKSYTVPIFNFLTYILKGGMLWQTFS